MSEHTNKTVPFFARFLEAQEPEPTDDNPKPSPSPFTYKFPSDWEDY
jgi:Serine endopeptidase inhibitors